jgi:probable addiction module antidote protein
MKTGKNLAAAVPQDDWLTEKLRDPELSAEYLSAALAEGDQAVFLLALRNVAKARGGVAALARDTGLNRVALSRALSESGNPELRSLTRLLEASGMRFAIVASKPVIHGGGKGRREELKGGDEWDAAHKRSRGLVPFRRGELKQIKRKMNKRARKDSVRAIRNEV